MSSLGSNIKYLREHHDISALAMSKKLQISLQDYNAWESGLSLPTITNVMDICAVFGLKNPTDLFSDNFIQMFNSSEIKTAKAVAKRKAEAQKLKGDTETKLTFFVKEGSYYSSVALFDICIMLALGMLVSMFLPSFIVGEKVYIGYLAAMAGVVPAIFTYLLAVLCIIIIFVGFRGNYRVIEGNEFLQKSTAIGLKLIYLFSGLLCATFAMLLYFTTEEYEYGLTIITALSIVFLMFAIMSSASIKPAKKDAVTYTYVIKFAKYKLKTNAPRKTLKIVSILGFALSLIAVALGVVQIVMDKVLLVDQLGINNGIVATITEGFYDMLPFVFGGLLEKIIVAVVALLVLATNLSNIIVSNKVKKTDYDGYLQDTQTKKVRKHLSVNFALDIISYVVAYALIITTLTSSAAGTKLLYQYYMIPILTVVSLLTALRYLLYPKVYGAFRGAETYENTGYSEVKMDEEKRRAKLEKKGKNPDEVNEKPEKQPKEKKKKGKKGEEAEETTEGGNE